MELSKNYDPKESEPRWQQHWADKKIFAFDPKSGKPVYSVDTPPPTVSGRMHLGHAFSYAQQDYVVRYQRMRGKNVFYPFGTDDNGLPTDKLVEKTKKIRSKDHSRNDYRKICLDFVNENKPEFVADWIRLGMSCDFSITYSTIDPHCQKTGQKSFLDLYKKGLLYQSESPVVWCPACQTAIAQAEFDNVDLTSSFNDIVFKCREHDLVIATTRPELLPACVALFAHPTDKRYAHLKGKFAKVPLFDYEVPILFDETADPEKGTGLMMCCTFGDKDDVAKWDKYKLPLRIALTTDGKMNEHVPGYVGLPLKEARKKITEALKEAGLLLRQEQITHAVNVHERCGTEIEFLKTRQWFIRILDHKEEFLAAADKISWYPAHMKVRYQHWVENLNWDWCISRQRFYGVPFPVWYKKDGTIVVADESQLPVDPFVDKPKGHEHDDLTPETDVMDTWMISSVSPQITIDWAEPTAKMQLYPMSLRPQAHDIIRTWAFYTITKGIYHHKDVPWKDIVISGHVLDPKGQKMSKSKGNAIAPQDVFTKYGADALRYWAAGVKLGDDLPYMEKDLQTGQKTVTKLWNAGKFCLLHLEDYTGYAGELEVMDRWLLAKLSKVIAEATKGFDAYEYSRAKFAVDQFFWGTFCDAYLEIAKGRLYDKEHFPEERASAQYALSESLLAILKLFAPILPHITEEIYQRHYAQREGLASIHVSAWPEVQESWINDEAEAVGDEVLRVIEAVRKYKTEKQLSLRAPIEKLIITSRKDLRLAEQDLFAVCSAKTLAHANGEFNVQIE